MMRALVVIVTLALLAVGAAWLFQRSLIYLPAQRVPPPADVGLPRAEPVRFATADGLELAGWFVPPSAQTPTRRQRRALARQLPLAGHAPAVLICNGNAGNRSARAPLAAALSDAGLGVLLFDYRGYGGNPGSPTEEGLLADARAARAALAARPEVDPERLVYFGESLGAGVAAALAAEDKPAALVLRSPFTSLAEVGRLHYPFLPVAALLRDRYPVAEHVAAYSGPLLVLAGAHDQIVPPGQSRRVAEAAAGAVDFVLLDGGHNDRALLDGDRLVGAVTAFLGSTGVLR